MAKYHSLFQKDSDFMKEFEPMLSAVVAICDGNSDAFDYIDNRFRVIHVDDCIVTINFYIKKKNNYGHVITPYSAYFKINELLLLASMWKEHKCDRSKKNIPNTLKLYFGKNWQFARYMLADMHRACVLSHNLPIQ